ncbi:MAG: cupin domain-containing protein, partial [Pseudomonadota bacterium]
MVAIKSAKHLESSPRYLVGLADEYPAGFVDEPHTHAKTQILYASSGVMSVVTDAASFIVPPRRAVWIPHGVEHEVSCRGAVSLRTLYVNPQFNREDTRCHIIEISPLLEALIVEVTQFALDYDNDGREA